MGSLENLSFLVEEKILLSLISFVCWDKCFAQITFILGSLRVFFVFLFLFLFLFFSSLSLSSISSADLSPLQTAVFFALFLLCSSSFFLLHLENLLTWMPILSNCLFCFFLYFVFCLLLSLLLSVSSPPLVLIHIRAVLEHFRASQHVMTIILMTLTKVYRTKWQWASLCLCLCIECLQTLLLFTNFLQFVNLYAFGVWDDYWNILNI